MPRDRDYKDKHFDELATSFAEGARTYLDTSEAEELIDYLIGKESYDEALAISDYALSLHSSSTSLLIQHAIILVILWRVEEARDILNYVSPLEQQNPNLYIAWGDLHVKDGDILKGLECYDKAIELNTDKEDYLDILIMIASRLNRDEQWSYVQKYADLYFQKRPNDPNMLFELAYAEEKCDHLEKSMELYENMLQRDPFSDSGWYNLALICTNLGKYDLAQKAFDNAISLNPDHSHCNYGNMLYSCGEYAKAVEQYALYIANTKNTPDFDVSVYQLLGDCFFNWALKEYEKLENDDNGAQLGFEQPRDNHIEYLLYKSIDFCKLCINEKFDEDHAWMQMGDSYSILGLHDKGLTCMDKAIRIEPNNPCSYYMKAAIYERENNLNYALQYLIDGIMHDPEPVRAWIELAKTLYKISVDKNSLTPEHVPPLKVFSRISGRFPNGPHITVAKSFLEYLEGKDSVRTYEALKKVVKNHPDVFMDACDDIGFQGMMHDKPYNNLIQDK